MKQFLEEILDRKAAMTPEEQDRYAQLEYKQEPNILYIGCCDSRVDPAQFASVHPGRLFILRNVGNLVPPPEKEPSVGAALEFATGSLGIKDIVICGHSNCGAMHAIQKKASLPKHLEDWLHFAEHENCSTADERSQKNVLKQCAMLSTYGLPEDVHFHGLWFDIGSATVHVAEQNGFHQLSERDIKGSL